MSKWAVFGRRCRWCRRYRRCGEIFHFVVLFWHQHNWVSTGAEINGLCWRLRGEVAAFDISMWRGGLTPLLPPPVFHSNLSLFSLSPPSFSVSPSVFGSVNPVCCFLHHLAFGVGGLSLLLSNLFGLSLLFMCIMKGYNHILHAHTLSQALRLYVSASKNNRIIILMVVVEDLHHCCGGCLSSAPSIKLANYSRDWRPWEWDGWDATAARVLTRRSRRVHAAERQ